MAVTPALPNSNGDMVKLTTNTITVGVLLDEIPAISNTSAIAFFKAKPDSWWTSRIQKQVFYSQYRLVFRNLFNWDLVANQLIVPNITQWTITMQPATTRVIDGHFLVVRDYSFSTYILGRFGDAVISDPRLGIIGNSVTEQFTFPVDPQLLIQRTGYAWYLKLFTDNCTFIY